MDVLITSNWGYPVACYRKGSVHETRKCCLPFLVFPNDKYIERLFNQQIHTKIIQEWIGQVPGNIRFKQRHNWLYILKMLTVPKNAWVHMSSVRNRKFVPFLTPPPKKKTIKTSLYKCTHICIFCSITGPVSTKHDAKHPTVIGIHYSLVQIKKGGCYEMINPFENF